MSSDALPGNAGEFGAWVGPPQPDAATSDPGGEVRALLLTDLVDSTETTSTLGDAAWATLGAAHDRIARDLLVSWRGREIDKTDGMLMLFGSAADAAGYAMAYHRAIAALDVPLKARAGLHVGAVILRANSAPDVARGAKPMEVEGIAKAIAARVMSLALGGQTLITAAARAALGESDLRVQTHGHWRVKGVAEPIELFELGGVDSPFTPPPDGAKAYRVVRKGDLWLPVRHLGHSLPAERDAFVGRQEALRELARRVDAGARLVSVLGIGGTGKTRFVTRFAWTWLGEFAGGAWFCDLAQARSVDGIVHAVAQGLGVALGVDDPVAQIGHAIAGRGQCLVILDNFEQVARHAEETLGRWLDRAGEARFVVTTREVLGLPGEEALALAPLPTADAATLFKSRAASAKRDFDPSADDQEAIGQLVKLLDGLPLAIELAAARVRVMPPRALLARMDQRFRLLTASGKRRDRQTTLRAAFDWSWDLLNPAEKAALAQLSVFEGGFTLDAAEAVLEIAEPDALAWSVDIVQSLVDKSFVRPLADARFDLLSSVQEYAAEHLATPGRFAGSGPEAVTAAQARHCAYFAGLDPKVALEQRCIELENLVVACRRAAASGHTGLAVASLESAWAALAIHGPLRGGMELAARVLAMPGLDEADRARVGVVAADACHATGDVAGAARYLDATLTAARATENRAVDGEVQWQLGRLLATKGQFDEAIARYTAALAIARDLGNRTLECEVLNGLGSASLEQGRVDEALAHYGAALAAARGAGDLRWEGGVLGNLGNVKADWGRMDEARADYEGALLAARQTGDRKFEGNALSNLGLLNLLQGRGAEARAQFEASLRISREIGHRRLEGIVLCNLGLALDSQGDLAEAQGRFEQSLAIARELADRRSQGQCLGYLGRVHALQARIGDARRCLGAGEALLIEVADSISLALLYCARAEVEQLAGQREAARQALGSAAAIALEVGAGPESDLGMSLARVEALLNESNGSSAERTGFTGC